MEGGRKGSRIYATRPSLFKTASVRRSQRLPANGNASMTTGPIFFSTLSRRMVRARRSRVFTVSGFNPRMSAVSSTFIPSIGNESDVSAKKVLSCGSDFLWVKGHPFPMKKTKCDPYRHAFGKRKYLLGERIEPRP